MHGDALEVLKTLPSNIVQCCVTSPPYWGLRDYGVRGQIGLEPSPEAYIEKLVAALRQVRRVLRNDGVLWLNLGDSYAGSGGAHAENHKNPGISNSHKRNGLPHWGKLGQPGNYLPPKGLKPKDLVGIPWRSAFALQADGWHLRSDIIWHKSNAMPESVTDRPTKAHEYIFLLTKSRRYFYNADAIREPHKAASLKRMQYGWEGNRKTGSVKPSFHDLDEHRMCHPKGANKRSVWTIAKRTFRGEHFAAFPYEIPETCIKAGSKLGDVVLDPFAGTGTSLEAAVKLGRIPLGVELNKKYIRQFIVPALRKRVIGGTGRCSKNRQRT